MTDPQRERMAQPGFQGVDPNLFDDPQKRGLVVAMVVGPDGQPAQATGGGGGTDPESAREATQQEVLTHVYSAAGNLYRLRNMGESVGLRVLPAISVQDWPPQQINVGVEQGLTVPNGATHALVTVAQGQVRIGLHDTTNGLILEAGDTYTLTGSQLDSFRLVYSGGGVDALVRVDYWREAHAAVTP